MGVHRVDLAAGEADAASSPHDLATEIARQLEATGEYRVTLEPGPQQRVIDLRWAALSAGRHLGRRVDVAVTRAGVDAVTAATTVRMTCAPAIPHQRDPEHRQDR